MTSRTLAVVAAVVLLASVAPGCSLIGDDDPHPLSLPDGPLIARASADGFVLNHPGGEVDFVTGINVGSAVPGRLPSELAIKPETWRRWLAMIGRTGVHAIRVYTLQPPHFYQELAAYNEAHPDDPLFVIHGIWIPEDLVLERRDLFDPDVLDQARADIDSAVAAIHGDIVLPDRAGYASGTYDTDVSRWVMGWAYGVEMDPELVHDNDARHAGRSYDGAYVTAAADATATEVWLAEMVDRVAKREAERGRSVPLTISNWPTTDPLTHPDEPFEIEDLAGIDMNHLVATEHWPAGVFANYHAYPYYPDFLRHEAALAEYRHRGEVDPYAGYLAQLRDHHQQAGLPLMILEFGLPTSLGSAHYGTNGRDQGGHDEAAAMTHVGDMLRTQQELGLSGGFIFAWQDEWFKRTWNTMETEVPASRRQLWQNPLSNEAYFGLLAVEPGASPSPIVIDGAGDDWKVDNSQALLEAPVGVREVRARHDAQYLYLRLVLDRDDMWLEDQVWVGFDVVSGGNPLPVGDLGARFDTAISIGPGHSAAAHIRASNDYNALVLGLAQGLHPVDPAAVEPRAGIWNPQRLFVNRPAEVPGKGPLAGEWFDLNPLPTGSSDPASASFDSRTVWAAAARTVELRVPWAMVGLADPSSRAGLVIGRDGQIGSESVDGIVIGVAADGAAAMTGAYRWESWNRVEWHERPKAGFEHLVAAIAAVKSEATGPASPVAEE